MERSSRTEIALRSAQSADVPFLLQLRHQTMDRHLAASAVEMSEEEHLRRVLLRFECAQIILVDGKPSGLLKVARDEKSWHLIQIQVVPHLQGSGLGSRLLREIAAEARDAGASVELDVLKVNPARSLYERLGFVVTAENSHSFDMRLTIDA